MVMLMLMMGMMDYVKSRQIFSRLNQDNKKNDPFKLYSFHCENRKTFQLKKLFSDF